MAKKPNRNDPCPCGSGKKYKKCCAVQKKLSARSATVITSTSANSLLSRISAGGKVSALSSSKSNSLKDRIGKTNISKDS